MVLKVQPDLKVKLEVRVSKGYRGLKVYLDYKALLAHRVFKD